MKKIISIINMLLYWYHVKTDTIFIFVAFKKFSAPPQNSQQSNSEKRVFGEESFFVFQENKKTRKKTSEDLIG